MAATITANDRNAAETIRSELEAARADFHALLGSLSEGDMHRQSLNPGWTNGEILAHMLFGFILVKALLPLSRLWGQFPRGSSKPFAWFLNLITRPFNWFNALGARLQGRVFTYDRLGPLYDNVHGSLLKAVESIREDEWERGMYYPTRWDSHFGEFMTLKMVCQYPVIHFHFHLTQIAH